MKKISLLIILVACLYSCKKDVEQNNNQNLQNQNNFINKSLFTNDSIYGVIHNEVLTYVSIHPNFPEITQDENTLKEYLNKYMDENYGITINEINIASNNKTINDLAINLYNDKKITKNIRTYLLILDSISINSNDIKAFDANIINGVNKIYSDNNLYKAEKFFIASSFLFFRSSTVYWYNSINDKNSPWFININYFPRLKSCIEEKSVFHNITLISFRDFNAYANALADCGCEDYTNVNATECYKQCARASAFIAVYASISSLFN